MAHVKLDLSGLTSSAIGEHGVSTAALDALSDRALAAVDRTVELRSAGTVGFLDAPDDSAAVRGALDFAAGLPDDVDTVVVLGIGGSSLGPHAVYKALARPYDQVRERGPGMPRRVFFPDNPDPQSFAALLETIDPRRTVFNVVTKSGGTAETAAQLLVVHDYLRKHLGDDAVAKHLIATTDPENGALRRLANQHGFQTFPIPANIGGRFSVLTSVGLVPAAAAGIDVVGLMDGARNMRDRVLERDLYKNPALLLASLLYLHHTELARPIHVMMPYVDALYELGHWFRQLWAESLGKQHDIDGKEIFVGPTPVAARGATDQHSQLQLYAGGPADKVFLFLTADERGPELTIPPGALSEAPEYGYLAGRGMGELLDAELRGTVASLQGRQRPTALVSFERVDAAAVGEFFMLFAAATAFAGPLYGVNPYDQPGVEEAKRLAYAGLGREGYDEDAKILAAAPASDPRFVL